MERVTSAASRVCALLAQLLLPHAWLAPSRGRTHDAFRRIH
jgi:hypothetical protein